MEYLFALTTRSAYARLADSANAVTCIKFKDMTHSPLQDDMHFRILRLLQEDPELSQRDLAKAVGVSVGRMNYVLKALVDKGFVKLGNFNASRDKRRYAYVLTPKGIAKRATLTRSFLARKLAEYEALREEIEALRSALPFTPTDQDRG